MDDCNDLIQGQNPSLTMIVNMLSLTQALTAVKMADKPMILLKVNINSLC
jgi:hypothetical protein